jgi:hypothetical protein
VRTPARKADLKWAKYHSKGGDADQRVGVRGKQPFTLSERAREREREKKRKQRSTDETATPQSTTKRTDGLVHEDEPGVSERSIRRAAKKVADFINRFPPEKRHALFEGLVGRRDMQPLVDCTAEDESDGETTAEIMIRQLVKEMLAEGVPKIMEESTYQNPNTPDHLAVRNVVAHIAAFGRNALKQRGNRQPTYDQILEHTGVTRAMLTKATKNINGAEGEETTTDEFDTAVGRLAIFGRRKSKARVTAAELDFVCEFIKERSCYTAAKPYIDRTTTPATVHPRMCMMGTVPEIFGELSKDPEGQKIYPAKLKLTQLWKKVHGKMRWLLPRRKAARWCCACWICDQLRLLVNILAAEQGNFFKDVPADHQYIEQFRRILAPGATKYDLLDCILCEKNRATIDGVDGPEVNTARCELTASGRHYRCFHGECKCSGFVLSSELSFVDEPQHIAWNGVDHGQSKNQVAVNSDVLNELFKYWTPAGGRQLSVRLYR